MRLLIVGSGGREHAIAWKLSQSENVKEIFVAPGNAGTAKTSKTKNLNIEPCEISELVSKAKSLQIDLTIVGPEAPLVKGIADEFIKNKINILGPNREGARLEGSKSFAKEFLVRHKIPTATGKVFTNMDRAKNYIDNCDTELVVKADGLASGKGVIITNSKVEAKDACELMLVKKAFGNAGTKVVVEEKLIGEEASIICLVNRNNFAVLSSSQDHKALRDGDKGPNTGGMGAISPTPLVNASLMKVLREKIIQPTIQGLRSDGINYIGFLYIGIIVEKSGSPKVLEYNCRLGDPETQALLMRLETDLAQLLNDAIKGEISENKIRWTNQSALSIVLASAGYPEAPIKTSNIEIKKFQESKNLRLFHCGTIPDKSGTLTSNGGRVLCITALANELNDAKIIAYKSTKLISFPNVQMRNDIGMRALLKNKQRIIPFCN